MFVLHTHFTPLPHLFPPVSFFIVAFGGSMIGVAYAIIISVLTKYTWRVQIIEAGFIFVLGYLSYLTAEMLSLSSILS